MLLKQNTAYNRMFFLGAGLSGVTVTISKNSAAFAPPDGSISAVGSAGWYDFNLAQSDTDTLGDLTYHFSASGGSIVNPDPLPDQVGYAQAQLADVVHGGDSAIFRSLQGNL